MSTFGNESPLDPVRSYPAPALVKAGTVTLPFKSVMVVTPSIDKRQRQARVRVIEEGVDGFTMEITTAEGAVDQLTWRLAAWPDHAEEIGKDSGWWVRRAEGSVSRIIVSNTDVVKFTAEKEMIEIRWEGPFEGRIDRTANGWAMTPDAFNAVTPKLLTFSVEREGETSTYGPMQAQPLEPNQTHELGLRR